MRWKFHPEASKEMFAAARYYELRTPGLGDEFLNEIEKSLDLISSFPNAFSTESAQARKSPVSAFPFSLVYLVENDTLIVVAVAHQRRNPDYWKSRIAQS